MANTEDSLHKLRSLRSDKTTEAEDFSLSYGKAYSAEGFLMDGGIILYFHNGIPNFVMVFRINVV